MIKKRNWLVVVSIVFILFSCGKDPLTPNYLIPATVDDDPSISAIEVNNTRLHLKTYGDASNPVMIFLHGGPGTGDHRAFERMLLEYDGYKLTDEYFIILYDQRGAGLSRRYGDMNAALQYAVPELTLSNYLKDLEEIVEIYAPNDKIFLFGHSWGGMHAVQYLNEHIDKVAGIMLSEPGSFNATIENELTLSIASTDLFGEPTNDVFWNHQNISPDNHEMLDFSYMNGFYNGLGPEYYHFSETDILPVFRFGAVASVNDLGSDGMTTDGTYTFDFTTNLHQFTTKVLFINGDLNEVLTTTFQEKNRAFFQNSEMKIITDVGHDLIWIKPGEHVKLMKEYLDSL